MLRVGVIGCGGMGRDHIRRLTEKIQGAEVVAVSDVFEESAKKAAEKKCRQHKAFKAAGKHLIS